MQIEVIRKEQLSELFYRYYIKLPKKEFQFFGYTIEAIEGLGSHHVCKDLPDCMEVDVPVSQETDFLDIIKALQVSIEKDLACQNGHTQ